MANHPTMGYFTKYLDSFEILIFYDINVMTDNQSPAMCSGYLKYHDAWLPKVSLCELTWLDPHNRAHWHLHFRSAFMFSIENRRFTSVDGMAVALSAAR